MATLELPFDDELREQLARHIVRAKRFHEAVTCALVLEASRPQRQRGALFIYDQICSRSFYFDRSILRRARIWAYRLLIRFPAIGSRVLLRFYSKEYLQQLRKHNPFLRI
jgi:hypothetical protein